MTIDQIKAAAITLNGAKANISGFANPYATITNVNGESTQCPWPAVEYRIQNMNGEFTS